MNKIGIIGHTGMVGSEIYKYFLSKGFYVLGYSTNPRDGFPQSTWEEINKSCNIIFICVPTPFNFSTKKSNFNIVEKVLGNISGNKIVVIKSTIWPGMTELFQKKFPGLRILFNPEFLSRTSAKKDFEKPDRQLMGYTSTSKTTASKILKLLPKGKYAKILKSSEAELIKYAHNVYGSLRIIYANHLYEVCKKFNLNYDEVKNGFAASDFIGPGVLRYMTIFHNGKRGYGGPCFPKDVNSYLEFCSKNRIQAEIIKGLRNANRRILKEQSLTEKQSEKF